MGFITSAVCRSCPFGEDYTSRWGGFKGVQQLRNERGNKKYKLTIRWIAGHEGVDEKADREAKKVADGQSSVKSTLPKYLRKGIKSSISARKQKRKEGLNKAGKRSGSRQSDTRDSRQKTSQYHHPKST